MRAVLTATGLVLVFLALLGGSAAAASAESPPAIRAAREALSLTRDRLELMDEVMASKWLSRAPIEDSAQEESVIGTAVAEGGALGVAAAGTRGLFEAEIAAAKEVQLGWGSHWLYYGTPPDFAAPDLGAVRAQLGEISRRLVAVLPRLTPLGSLPQARERVMRAGRRILRVRYLGTANREAIVDALLAIRASTNTFPPR